MTKLLAILLILSNRFFFFVSVFIYNNHKVYTATLSKTNVRESGGSIFFVILQILDD